MPVPFIRQYPNGRRKAETIIRGREVERLAAEFIDCAGRYLIEIQRDGDVKLMAIIDLQGGCTEVATEIVENGPALLEVVDRLVRASVKNIPLRTLAAPANQNGLLELVP